MTPCTWWLISPTAGPLALPSWLAAEWHAEGKFAGRIFVGTFDEASALVRETRKA